MKSLPLLLATLPLAVVACQAHAHDQDRGHHAEPGHGHGHGHDDLPLMLWQDGDPFEQGWSMAGPGTFVVEDGVLMAQGGMGMLWYTPQDFADFELQLEWRVEDPAHNTGVFVRFPDPGTDPWVAVNEGYEIQICDTGTPKHDTGSVYSFQDSTSTPTLEAGGWNQYRIRVVGQEYTIWVNGEMVNEFTGERTLRGHIGLQNHDDHSPVRFRNIRVLEIQ